MSTDQISGDAITIATPPEGEIAEAVANGVLGERVWFYANYHCNLECTYCLTESGPNVDRKMLDAEWMIARAHEAKALGFKQLGVTGGEPFMVSSMPETIAFHGPRLERIVEALAGKNVHIQISLDAPEPGANDTKRGDDNWRQVSEAVPRLVARGLKVRIATTTEGITEESLNELCVLHREWGVPDEDHVVRPIVSRGRAALDGIGVAATQQDLPAELCLTTDGAFWSAFGPTIRNGRTDTDLLITRVTAPLERPAKAMLRVAQATPAGTDAALGIR
jgi:sulfatase maturation enzyme AslB (radical SAM superfamily)